MRKRTVICLLPAGLLCLTFFLGGSPSGARAAANAPQSGGFLLVANQGDRDLSIIDPIKNLQVAAVAEDGIRGHEVIASKDGRTAFVPLYGSSGVGKPGTDGQTMDVIDIASRKLVHTVDFGHGVRPHCPVIGPKDGLLYVTTELDKSITIIDPKTLKIVGSIPTGQEESHMLAISSDGKRGYTANVGPGSVSVLDLPARKTIAIIPISATTQRISISADNSMVFTADQTKPQLAVIDTATNKLKTWIALPSIAYGTASTHDGRFLIVAVAKANTVAVVDLKTLKVVRSVDVPASPQEVLVRPDDRVAYVSCSASHKIAAIDLDSWAVQLIEGGQGADGLAWAASN